MTTDVLAKVPTGNVGLDHILHGGVGVGRTTLVSGTAGSGKTVFAIQFLLDGLRHYGQSGVFVTFEEKPDRIKANAASLGFDIDDYEASGQWVFVDASEDPLVQESVVGPFDFSALMARIKHAVDVSGATRVSVDSIGAVFARFADATAVRRELTRLAHWLGELGVVGVLTTERLEDYGSIGRFGVEEFVCDNVVVLRNALEEETRRRTIEVLKIRGSSHDRGEFGFTILPGRGIVVLSREGIGLDAASTEVRVPSGLPELDEMCNGGLFRDSILLVTGATGTGKTLMVTEFIDGGARSGERSLVFSFEESRAQLFRNASGWGRDFAAHEHEGLLKVVASYPESATLEDHLVNVRSVIEEYNPSRIAIDSLSALERIAPARSFREFLVDLTAYVKHRQAAVMMTSTARTLLGGESVTESHVSTLTDMIVLLRYAEVAGEIRRALTVLKLRGSTHDKRLREYTIDGSGMRIGAPFREAVGVLSGQAHPSSLLAPGD